MKKLFAILIATIAATLIVATTASASVIHPKFVYCVGVNTVGPTDNHTLANAARYGTAVEVITIGQNTYYLPDFDEDPADTTDDATVTLGACVAPAFIAGPSATFQCNYPAGNPGIMSNDWDSAVATLANGAWNPTAVAGALPAGQGETYWDADGNPWHLDCGNHSANLVTPATWITDGGTSHDTAVVGMPGWYQEATK